MKCGSPGDLPRCDVGDDKLDLQVELVEFMEDYAGHKIVKNKGILGVISLGLTLSEYPSCTPHRNELLCQLFRALR